MILDLNDVFFSKNQSWFTYGSGPGSSRSCLINFLLFSFRLFVNHFDVCLNSCLVDFSIEFVLVVDLGLVLNWWDFVCSSLNVDVRVVFRIVQSTKCAKLMRRVEIDHWVTESLVLKSRYLFRIRIKSIDFI